MSKLDETALTAAKVAYRADTTQYPAAGGVAAAITAYLAACEPGPVVTREEIAQHVRDIYDADGKEDDFADYVLSLLRSRPAPVTPQLDVTDQDVFDACMTWRHDFGLLAPDDDENRQLVYEMRKILTRYAERVAKRPRAAPVVTPQPFEVTHVQWRRALDLAGYGPKQWPDVGTSHINQAIAEARPVPAEGVVDVNAFAKKLLQAWDDRAVVSTREECMARALLAVGLDKLGGAPGDITYRAGLERTCQERDKLTRELAEAREALAASEHNLSVASDVIAAWRAAVERPLGEDSDPREHTPQWAEDALIARAQDLEAAESRAADLQGRLESAEAELDEFHCAHCGLSCAPERTAYSLRGRLDTLRSNVAELAEMFDGRKDGPWSPDAARRLRAALAATAEQKPAEPVKCDYADECPGHAQASDRPCGYEPAPAADPVPAAHEALVARLDRVQRLAVATANAMPVMPTNEGYIVDMHNAMLDLRALESDAPPASDVYPSKP
jgi:hypothetical protein